MESRPSPPPEAALIRLARKAAGLTVSEAARRAAASMARGISTSRWSQIENGYEVRAGGGVRGVEADAGMLAHMAGAVGIDPERLESEGRRPDAAEILREMNRTSPAALPPGPRRSGGINLPAPYAGMVEEQIAEIEALLAAAAVAEGIPVEDLLSEEPETPWIPDGAALFGDDSADALQDAWWWDTLRRLRRPGRPYTAWQLVRTVAALRVRHAAERGQQGGTAAGLTAPRAGLKRR